MDGDSLPEWGTDLGSSFTFENGDLVIAEGKDNLIQSVMNRLNTDLDELDLIYESEYGSVLKDFFGWKASEETLSYIQSEIDIVLMKEPRLISHEITVYYDGNGVVRIELIMVTSTEDIVETNFILGNDGVIEIETDEEDSGDEENEAEESDEEE